MLMDWISVGLGALALVVAIVAAVQGLSLKKRLETTSNMLTSTSGSLQQFDNQLEQRVEVLEDALVGQ